MNCTKSEYHGRCCCNCENQRAIVKHPWNDGVAKGSISNVMGYGCETPEFTIEFTDNSITPAVIFFDSPHGMCEMHCYDPETPNVLYT